MVSHTHTQKRCVTSSLERYREEDFSWREKEESDRFLTLKERDNRERKRGRRETRTCKCVGGVHSFHTKIQI